MRTNLLLQLRWSRDISTKIVIALALLGAPGDRVLASDVPQPVSTQGASSTEPQSPNNVLQGAAQHGEVIKPSLKVLPDKGLNNGKQATLEVRQFAAGAQYSPGQPAPIPVVISRIKTQFPLSSQPLILQPRLPLVPLNIGPPSGPSIPVIQQKPVPVIPYTMTPSNGIMCWSPASASKIVCVAPQPLLKTGSSAGFESVMPVLPRRTIRWMPRTATLTTELVAPPAVQPRLAVAQRLSVFHAGHDDIIDWDGWYKRVSNSIYQVWAKTDAYPGEAKVMVTVWKGRAVDCRISDYAPAADVARDAAKEAAFRQAAINSIYALQKCEILDFPYESQKRKVVFEVDMQALVNGTVGCAVDPLHDSELAGASRTAGAKR